MQSKAIFFLFFSCFGIIVSCKAQTHSTGLTVTEFEQGIAGSNIQLLDVRTAGEYQSGHLANALLADWTNEKEFRERVSALDKDKPVYTYCLSGARSGAATQWLQKNGFTAYNLSGGINAWKQANRPVQQAIPVKQLTEQEYFSLIPIDKTVLVDVGAVWCPPCRKMNPVVDSLAKADSNLFALVKIDGSDQSQVAKTLKIDGFPTFIIYKNGKETWRKQGALEPAELANQYKVRQKN